jgi:hypothetical protein
VDRHKERQLVAVLDLLFVVVTLAFFALGLAYVSACKHLE